MAPQRPQPPQPGSNTPGRDNGATYDVPHTPGPLQSDPPADQQPSIPATYFPRPTTPDGR